MKYIFSPAFIFGCIVSALSAVPAFATPIQLDSFTSTPFSSIDFEDGGITAVFKEGSAASMSLHFDSFVVPNSVDLLYYQLTVPLNNHDFFDVYINDWSTPTMRFGGGPTVYSGFLDLSIYSGQTIDLGFSLDWGGFTHDSGTDSQLILSSLPTNPIPEPGTLLLMGTGLAGLLSLGRKNK